LDESGRRKAGIANFQDIEFYRNSLRHVYYVNTALVYFHNVCRCCRCAVDALAFRPSHTADRHGAGGGGAGDWRIALGALFRVWRGRGESNKFAKMLRLPQEVKSSKLLY
jgi:hypothetical protein